MDAYTQKCTADSSGAALRDLFFKKNLRISRKHFI